MPPDDKPKSRIEPPPDAVLLSVLPRWLVVTLAVVCFFIPTAILIASFVAPDIAAPLGTAVGRFLFCLVVALYLAVFFFVLFPQNVVMERVPVVNVPVRIVGPIVLWILILLLLLIRMPYPESGRLFEPRHNGQPATIIFSVVTIEPAPGENLFTYYRVPDGSGNLAGVYIEFPANASAVKAVVKAERREDVEWTFQRGGANTFEIGAVKPPP